MTLTVDNVLRVKREMKRFQEALDRFEDRMSADNDFRKFHNITGFRETAAVKRASMDLSRALTDLRRRSQ